MPESSNNCPDCQAEMQPIKIIDATNPGYPVSDQGIHHIELSYAAEDASPTSFWKKIPKAGSVKARICPECARIVLHGEPTPSEA